MVAVLVVVPVTPVRLVQEPSLILYCQTVSLPPGVHERVTEVAVVEVTERLVGFEQEVGVSYVKVVLGIKFR